VRACAAPAMLATVAVTAACGAPRAPAPAPGPVGCWRFDSAYFPVVGRDPRTNALVSLRTSELALLGESPPYDELGVAPAMHAIRPIPFDVDTFTV